MSGENVSISTNGDAALSYASRGWPVFPCREKDGAPYTDRKGKTTVPKAKEPYTSHGVKDATTDPEKIRAWWNRWPDAAIGLDCGRAGLLVVDLDVKHGHNGPSRWASLGIADAGALLSQTPSGGRHIIFAQNGVLLGNTSGKLGDGIDTRGHGGYIILPPSRTADGVYVALNDWRDSPATIPGVLTKLLTRPEQTQQKKRNNTEEASPGDPWALAALRSECARVANAMKGTRNDTLNQAAIALGELVGAGYLTQSEVENALFDAAAHYREDDGDRAAENTISSGMKKGMAQPRYKPMLAPASPAIAAQAGKTKPQETPAGADQEEDVSARLEKMLAKAAALEAGPARDEAIEELFPWLLRLPGVAQTRYKRKVVKALPELGARDYERLLQAARQAGRQNEQHRIDRYPIVDGRQCYVRYMNGESYPDPLADFTAEIFVDEVRDDGAGAPARVFSVRGKTSEGIPFPSGTVEASKFAAMSWPTDLWGVRAVIRAGRDTKDRLREAIQLHSRDAGSRYIFTHTGWRDVDGNHVYLTGAGAVGDDGVTVELDRELSRYRLPAHPEAIADAMRASLRFLDVAPYEITIPLWASAYLAPLAEIVYPGFMLWLYGKSGTLKSSLAALSLCHYGEFTDKTLFGWSDTANRLEMNCFLLKDAPIVIDDFAPQSDPFKAREMERNAAQIVRNVGNQAGRGRMRRDLSMAATYRPRGLVISTGEQVPDGESISARLFTLEIHPGDVNMERLSAAQNEAWRYPHALSGYLLWLAGQWPALAENLPTDQREMRDRARVNLSGIHLRLPEALSQLYMGFDLGLKYAVEVGALSVAEMADWEERGFEALKKGAEAQAARVEKERPTVRFLEVLTGLLAQGKVHLEHKEGKAKIGGGSANDELLGWYDEERLYLLLDAAYNRVARFLRDEGAVLSVKQAALRKYLVEEGILLPPTLSESDDDKDKRTTDVIRIGGAIRRVACFSRSKVVQIGGELPPEKLYYVKNDGAPAENEA